MKIDSQNPVTLSVVIGAGSLALISLGIQPLSLGSLAAAGWVSDGAIGLLAMLEIAAIAFATVTYAVSRWRVRDDVLLVLSGAALVYAQWASGQQQPLAQLAFMRAIAGLAEGLAVAVTVGHISRAARPDHLTAIFLLVQTFAQIAMSLDSPAIATPDMVAMHWFGRLSLIGGAIAMAGLIAGKGASMQITAAIGRPSRPSILMMASITTYLAVVGAVWSYAERMADLQGLTAQDIQLLTAMALFASLIGSGISIPLLIRLDSHQALRWSWTGMALSLLALYVGPTWMFQLGLLVFGFLWTFAIPFQAQVLLRSDDGRAMLTLSPLAQLGGMALGALVAGGVVEASGPFGSLAVAAVMVAASVWSGAQAEKSVLAATAVQ